MRKHFLLLFLMAILPLAGWAASLEDATIIVPDIEYGAAAPVVYKVQIGTVELAATTEYTVDYTVFYQDEDCTLPVLDGNSDPVPATKLPAGFDYYVKVTGAGIYSDFKGGKFKVKQRALTVTVTVTDGLSKVYDGTAGASDVTVPAYTLTLSAGDLKNGDLLKASTEEHGILKGTLKYAYEGTNANVKPDGSDFTTPVPGYDVEFSGVTADNYKITFADGKIDIKQKSIEGTGGALATGIAISSTGNIVIYNKQVQLPSYTVTFNGADLSEADFAANFDVTPSSVNPKNVGDYTITITGKKNFAGSHGYVATAADKATYQLKINPAVAIVKANKKTRAYDGTTTAAATALTGITFAWTGVYTGDTFTGTPTANVNEDAKDAGEYNIVLTAPASWGNDNYTVGLDNSGVYEITPVALTITADDKTVSYGDDAPALTATITGAINAGELAELKKGVTAQFISTFTYEGKAAGAYANVIEPVVDATQAADTYKNYTYTNLVKGKLTINAAQILVSIQAKSKTYGTADPTDLASSVVVTGATAGLITAPTVKRAPGEDVGTYLMTIDTEATVQEGYEILYTSIPVYFTINKADLTITALTQIMTPKTDVAAATAALNQNAISIEGLTNGDTSADIKYSLAVAALTNVSDAGTKEDKIVVTAPATFDGKQNKNYNIAVVTGDLVISSGASLATIELPADGTLMDILNYNNGANINAKVEFDRDGQVLGTGADKNREWDAEKWNSLVLPFDITIKQLSATLGYAIVNVVDAENSTANNVKFKLKMSGKIDANTPFIVKTEDPINDLVDANGFITFEDVTIKKPASAYPSIKASSDALGYTFVGAYQTKTIDKNESYLRFLVGNINSWAFITSTSTSTWDIVPFAAYVNLTSASAAREVTFTMEELDGSTTTIRSINADSVNDSKFNAVDGWYTLNGVKLNAAPTEKGIYINNGKKVVVK